jgi:DNA-binding NarL/FixJ family response regulator
VREFDVLVVVRNEMARYGLERMLSALPQVRSVAVAESLADVGCLPAVDLLVAALADVGERGFTAPAGVKSLLVVDCSNTREVVRVANTAADGFLDLADLSAAVLADALRRIDLGEVPMPAKLVRGLLAEVRNGRRGEPAPRTVLTPREGEVLALLVEGLSNKQIAHRLGISGHGVKRLVSSILAKLNCPNRTLAVAKVVREGGYRQPVAV